MQRRKIILVLLCFILALTFIIQLATGTRETQKTLTLSTSPDAIDLISGSSTVHLALDNMTWFVGNDNYQAETYMVNSMTNNLKELRVLSTVGTLKADEANEKYELNDTGSLTVKAWSGDKLLRTLRIGKATATGSQSYVTLDGGNDIYLVSGNYKSIFLKTEDELKSKSVFSIASDAIVGVDSRYLENKFSIMKDATPTIAEKDKVSLPTWHEVTKSAETPADNKETQGNLTPTGDALNTEKVNTWLSQLSTCTALSWIKEDDVLATGLDDGNKISSLLIKSNAGDVSIEVYKKTVGEETKYIATSNKTPHKFELGSASLDKYQKQLSDLK